MRSDWTPPHLHIKHWNKPLHRKLVIVRTRTGEDPLDVRERRGYSRSARELRPAGDKCGRAQRNVDIVKSRRNGPQLSTRHDDDNDDGGFAQAVLTTKANNVHPLLLLRLREVVGGRLAVVHGSVVRRMNNVTLRLTRLVQG